MGGGPPPPIVRPSGGVHSRSLDVEGAPKPPAAAASPSPAGSWLGRAARFCTVAPLQSGQAGFWDAVLLVAGLQIGQIMLVMPRAIWLMGMAAGMAVSAASLGTGGWTLYVLLALYLEYRARRGDGGGGGDAAPGGKGRAADASPGLDDTAAEPGPSRPVPPLDDPALPLAQNTPASGRGVVQYHDVVAALGWPRAALGIQALTAVALLGIAVAQILACATNTYAALDSGSGPGGRPRLTKRAYALAWGGAMLIFTAVPSYKDTRVINVVALLGTTFTAWYIVAASRSASAVAAPPGAPPRLPTPPGPASARNFFLGATIMVGSLSGHVICMEIFDALGGSARFLGAYLLAQVWVLTLTIVPAGVAAAAFGSRLSAADSVYGVLPPSAARATSAWLMNVHQVVVFGLVLMPLFYYVERAVGLHPGVGGGGSGSGSGGGASGSGGGAGGGPTRRRLASLTGWRRYAARMAARLPVSLLVWLLALAFPFYGAINALTTSLAFPALSFLFPCALFNRLYGRRGPAGAAARAAAPLPPTLGGLVPPAVAWPVAIAANWVLVGGGLAFMVASVYFSVGAVVRGVRADGVFAPCWQCGPPSAGGGVVGKG